MGSPGAAEMLALPDTFFLLLSIRSRIVPWMGRMRYPGWNINTAKTESDVDQSRGTDKAKP